MTRYDGGQVIRLAARVWGGGWGRVRAILRLEDNIGLTSDKWTLDQIWTDVQYKSVRELVKTWEGSLGQVQGDRSEAMAQ